MIRLFFWILLLANVVLIGLHQGFWGNAGKEVRNPEKLANQMNTGLLVAMPEEVRVVPAVAPAPVQEVAVPAAPEAVPEPVPESIPEPEPEPAVAPVAAVPAPATKPPPPPIIANICVELGYFSRAEANRAEATLVRLSMPTKRSERKIEHISSYMVHVVVKGGQAAADRRVAQLRRSGIKDFYVIPGSYANESLRWNISLGVFKTEQAAQQFVAALKGHEIADLAITPRASVDMRQYFKFAGITPGARERLARAFTETKLHACR